MRRGTATSAKVIWGVNESLAAKVPAPNTVDQHTARQRMVRCDQPFSKFAATTGSSAWAGVIRAERFEHPAGYLIAQIVRVSSAVEFGVRYCPISYRHDFLVRLFLRRYLQRLASLG
jgi:hypothetical protein